VASVAGPPTAPTSKQVRKRSAISVVLGAVLVVVVLVTAIAVAALR